MTEAINLDELLTSVKRGFYKMELPSELSDMAVSNSATLNEYMEFKLYDFLVTQWVLNLLISGNQDVEIERIRKLCTTKAGLAQVAHFLVSQIPSSIDGIENIHPISSIQ